MVDALIAPSTAHQVCHRVKQLQQLHRERVEANRVIRDICSGGEAGLRAILGNSWNGDSKNVPAANMVMSGLHRLGQKVGRMPDLRVDVPPKGNDSDSARKRAERIRRIVADYDDAVFMRGKVAQIGLWLPAYGFSTMAVCPDITPDGNPFPGVKVRDSYGTYPGEFHDNEQPRDCAWMWQWTYGRLRDFCDAYDRWDVWQKVGKDLGWRNTGIMLEAGDTPVAAHGTDAVASSSWSPNGASGSITVAEYRDPDGVWLVLPDHGQVLTQYDAPIAQPTFYVMSRHTIGETIGHYDHVIGMQSALVKMNTLALIAMEDASFSETNIEGQVLSGKYRRGRFAVNHLERGSQVTIPQRSIPYQYFQEIQRLEMQFRTTAGYPVTDDAVSPAAQATGQGIERLNQPIDLEVKQYYDIIDRAMERIDAARLEWDEKMYGDRKKPLVGQRDGQPYAEEYTPRKHIGGWYRTRRTHGAMAGLSDSAKVVGLLQLKGAGIVDTDTVREQLDGLGDVSQIADRVQSERVGDMLMQMMTSGAQVDPRVALTMIEMLPEGKQKATFKRFWTPEEPAMSPEQEAMLAGPPGPAAPPGPPPDVTTMLARLTAGGPQGGVQMQGPV